MILTSCYLLLFIQHIIKRNHLYMSVRKLTTIKPYNNICMSIFGRIEKSIYIKHYIIHPEN
jgi:hypothetical protein